MRRRGGLLTALEDADHECSMLCVAVSWGFNVPELISRLALKPDNYALIDIQKHCRCTNKIQDPAPVTIGLSSNMKEYIQDSEFAKSSRHDSADIENPFVQKAGSKMSGINRQ